MPGKIIITKDNFYPFILKFNKDFNIFNTEYIDNLSNEFFEKYGQNILKCKACIYLKKLLSEKYENYSISKLNIKYWNALGYFNTNEIVQKMQKYKQPYHVFFDEFIKNPDKYISNINLNNKLRIKELAILLFDNELCIGTAILNKRLSKEILKFGKAGTQLNVKYWLFRGWTEDEANKIISEMQRKRSIRCKDYYTSRGFSEDEADKLVSNIQSKYSNKGKHSYLFWMARGFSKDDAINIAHEYSQSISIWCKKYWLSKGFSDEEADKQLLKYNPSSPSFFKYNGDYKRFEDKIKRWSKLAKSRWQTDEYRDKMIQCVKDGTIKTTSKVEIKVFEQLKNWNNNIKHDPYIVIIPNDFQNAINSSFYSVDGYYNDKDGVILIEYDSNIYHSSELDFIRDNNILSIDPNVLGIIRIQQSFLKFLEDKKDIFNDAIQKIKNTKENRIILS